jgi:hypothetical protein
VHGTAVIQTTSSHLFWNAATRQWVKATSLRNGGRLRTPVDTTITVVGGFIPADASGLMWDLTVVADHDFYVVTAVGSILAHNCPASIWADLWKLPVKTYQTYTKVNPDTGQVYSGRTSGYGTPDQNVARRDIDHDMPGFEPAELDQSSENPMAIRGREQMLIEYYQEVGISSNEIPAVSPSDPEYGDYMWAALEEFGWAPEDLP